VTSQDSQIQLDGFFDADC